MEYNDSVQRLTISLPFIRFIHLHMPVTFCTMLNVYVRVQEIERQQVKGVYHDETSIECSTVSIQSRFCISRSQCESNTSESVRPTFY